MQIRKPAAVLVRPLQEFVQTEAAGGMLLLVAALTALLWANLPNDSYVDFWSKHLTVNLDSFNLELTLGEWVNDGLMAIFFFVVGLEIKRELLRGELAEPRRAALPVAAAIGGMVLPAAIYLSLNAGSGGADGWGIPMATDIAFSVGLLALLGTRVPTSLKVFLLALAIVDDLGAIAVIAIFYTDDLSFAWLALAGGMFALMVLAGRLGVRDLIVYLAIGIVAWLAMHESGVHATVAGVVLGLLTPIDPHYDAAQFRKSAGDLVQQAAEESDASSEDGELSSSALRELEELARESQSPLDRLEQGLHPWSSYLIIPVFALANAGVDLSGEAVRDAATSRVGWGVALGLMVGKPIGIVVASYIAVRIGVAVLPGGAVRWSHILALGMVAGVGFTVSLFITSLAFTNQSLVQEAKIAILAGSALIGAGGLVALRLVLPAPSRTDGLAMEASE